MFDLANWRNPETLFLNITNGLLGIATIVLVVWICGSAIYEHRAVSHKPSAKH